MNEDHLSVQPTIKSGLTDADTKWQRRYLRKTCVWCQKTFTYKNPGPANLRKHIRLYCSNKCKALAQGANQEIQAQWRAAMQETWTNSPLKGKPSPLRGRPNPAFSARLRTDNPMFNPETRRKASESLRAHGRKPPGGYGFGQQVAPAQAFLASHVTMELEYLIVTTTIRHLIENLPTYYRADLADPLRKLVVEVDGKSHLAQKRRISDAKKDKALALLGWSVLRFSNQEVMENITSVVARIQSFTT